MAQVFNTGLKDVVWRYLQYLGARVTQTSIEKDIEENPNYPSLLSLSESFDRYKIDNSAYEVTQEYFEKLTPPFVAYLTIPGVGKDFVLVTAINEKIDFLYKEKKKHTLSKEEFLKRFQQIIWKAEPDERSGESGYEGALRKERVFKVKRAVRYAVTLTLLLIAVGINVPLHQFLPFVSIVLLKISGLATTAMLLLYEVNSNNTFINNLCSAGHANCEAVLHSKAARIKSITWSEIGFFYFAATLLLLLIPTVTFNSKTALVAGVSMLATPYVLFSLFYQWRIIRQWCMLCLIVQAILLSEMLWSILNFWTRQPVPWQPRDINPTNLLEIIFCLLFPVVTWYSIKPFLARSKDAATYRTAYKRLQYHPEIFSSLLLQQAMAPDGWEQLGITLGNPTASKTIIKVCNAYCGPCARAHPELEEIIKLNSDVQLKIIFTAGKSEHDKSAVVTRHLLAIASFDDPAKTQQSLDDWYLAKDKDYSKFAAKYPLNGKLEAQGAKIEAMREWCDAAEITHTPTIFVNGYRLPENYRIDDLKHLLFFNI